LRKQLRNKMANKPYRNLIISAGGEGKRIKDFITKVLPEGTKHLLPIPGKNISLIEKNSKRC
jgi:hypothetical protein